MTVSDSFQIEMTGAVEALRALKKLGATVPKEIKGIMFDAGVLVARDVDVPIEDGDLATTLRVTKRQDGVGIRLGNARVPYGLLVELGAPRRNIEPNPIVLEAFHRQSEAMIATVERGIDTILTRENLT